MDVAGELIRPWLRSVLPDTDTGHPLRGVSCPSGVSASGGPIDRTPDKPDKPDMSGLSR
jgi:hypothetical protein